jgi:hypothetical protein
VERADEPRANPTEDAESGVLGSDVLVLMAAAGLRLREVTAREEPPEAVRPAGEVDPTPAPEPLAPLARARDGVRVAPGWGRRAPPPIR